MRTKQTVLALTTGLTLAALALPSAHAMEKITRKSGMWDISVETKTAGQPSPPPMNWQVCIDEKQDNLGAPNTKNESQPCDKTDIKRNGNEIVIDSVCKYDETTTIGHTVITGDLSSSYRMENTNRFDPPMHDIKSSTSIMTGKWLGVCNPKQRHGSMIMSKPAGEPNISAEDMKRLHPMEGPKK